MLKVRICPLDLSQWGEVGAIFRHRVSDLRQREAQPARLRNSAGWLLIGALIVALSNASPLRADPPPVTSTPLLSTDTTANGQRIEVPPQPQVIASRLEIPPGASLPMHEHPYPRYAYVLSGTLEVTTADGKVSRYHAGDFFTEVIGQCHSGRDAGDQPVQLLLIDQVVPGKSNTVPCP